MFSALQSPPGERHEHWMREALRAAYEARDRDEVPIGTCVVVYGELLAVAGNRTRTDGDPTAHAEVVALREAARKVRHYRLTEAGGFPPPCTRARWGRGPVLARDRGVVFG